MSATAPLICLITPGHVASTPRLVKEANALVEAGYRVHVVFGRNFPAADRLDADILRSAGWRFTRVDLGRGAAGIARKILRRLARRLVVHPRVASVGVAARANSAESLHLGRVAARLSAALYVGHCLPALPAAALAARRAGGAYGFDAEDFHDAETEAALSDPAERMAASVLQSRLLSGCAHLTASSPLISRRYEEVYRVRPRTVLNVFPLDQAPEASAGPGTITAARPARIYWFSQTIGEGRGLEAIVSVLGRMRTPAELQLRGFPAPGYAGHLQALAIQAGLRRPIRFLAPGPPSEMARLAASADLGLSTEESRPLNRDLCLTNKIFVYLLAGIPQLLSDTAAQSALAPELGEAAFLADLRQPDAVAAILDEFLSDPGRVAAARRKARELAAQRFCWDVEKSVFLDSIRAVVPP
jgi:glycosyltransferase involved in cell wall biosynthesis